MKRNTFKYVLKDKSDKEVYFGTTNDLKRRETEHHNDGKKFARLEKVGNITTPQGAAEWEEKAIKDYMAKHHGRLPKYNKNDTGK